MKRFAVVLTDRTRGENLRLESVGITVPLNSLYEGLELSPQ